MNLIPKNDPRYFEVSSDGLYDRHHYKVVSTTGDAIVVDNWSDASLIWFQKSPFLSYIEVLDKKQEKGFK
jgi:hypothetical protein